MEFSRVDFSYVKRPTQLIEDFSLDVKPGQRVAIVGPTSGKTTLINLLMCFYDINSGKLAIDGHSIEDITVIHCEALEWCFRNMASNRGPVRENITMGNPTISERRDDSHRQTLLSYSWIRYAVCRKV